MAIDENSIKRLTRSPTPARKSLTSVRRTREYRRTQEAKQTSSQRTAMQRPPKASRLPLKIYTDDVTAALANSSTTNSIFLDSALLPCSSAGFVLFRADGRNIHFEDVTTRRRRTGPPLRTNERQTFAMNSLKRSK